MRRQYAVFGDVRFERLAGLSNGHLYNLRRSATYRRQRTVVAKTQATHSTIGHRRKPQPGGQPGYVRVDTVHQGDQDGAKGVYHVNMVDDVTQFQFVGNVQAISERFLLPVLEGLIKAFPFVIQGIHADNGSESIHHCVAALLNKLRIGAFTKSRPRHCNDNALAESKNASVVRKHLGHGHIPRRLAPVVNEFTQHVLSPFLNTHRPCLFPTHILDAKGRVTKRYRDSDVMTPYDKLKSLDNAERFLNPGVSPSTSSTPSPTPSATSRPPTRSTMPATPCSSPSGALGATRPDPPPHPHNPPSGLIRAVAPSGATPLSPTPPLSHRPPLSTRAGDRSGLAQVLRALQHPPSIHSLPNSAYRSCYLPPSGSSPYWKRLTGCLACSTRAEGPFIGRIL